MIECDGFSVLLEPTYSGPAMSPTAAFELGDADSSGALNATDGAGRTPTTYAVQARALACIELLQSTPGAKHDKAAHDELDGMRRTMAEEDRAAAAGGQTTESLKGCSFLCDVVLCGGDTSIPG